MSAPIDRFFSIIPAGGIGSRLWPLSRAAAPKFLHDLTGSGQTLLQDTWDRLIPLTPASRILVVTGEAHEEAVSEQLEGLVTANLVLEKSPKDSTAAIALAAAILAKREPDVIVGSFAADHVIVENSKFEKTVREAVEVAAGEARDTSREVLTILQQQNAIVRIEAVRAEAAQANATAPLLPATGAAAPVPASTVSIGRGARLRPPPSGAPSIVNKCPLPVSATKAMPLAATQSTVHSIARPLTVVLRPIVPTCRL